MSDTNNINKPNNNNKEDIDNQDTINKINEIIQKNWTTFKLNLTDEEEDILPCFTAAISKVFPLMGSSWSDLEEGLLQYGWGDVLSKSSEDIRKCFIDEKYMKRKNATIHYIPIGGESYFLRTLVEQKLVDSFKGKSTLEDRMIYIMKARMEMIFKKMTSTEMKNYFTELSLPASGKQQGELLKDVMKILFTSKKELKQNQDLYQSQSEKSKKQAEQKAKAVSKRLREEANEDMQKIIDDLEKDESQLFQDTTTTNVSKGDTIQANTKNSSEQHVLKKVRTTDQEVLKKGESSKDVENTMQKIGFGDKLSVPIKDLTALELGELITQMNNVQHQGQKQELEAMIHKASRVQAPVHVPKDKLSSYSLGKPFPPTAVAERFTKWLHDNHLYSEVISGLKSQSVLSRVMMLSGLPYDQHGPPNWRVNFKTELDEVVAFLHQIANDFADQLCVSKKTNIVYHDAPQWESRKRLESALGSWASNKRAKVKNGTGVFIYEDFVRDNRKLRLVLFRTSPHQHNPGKAKKHSAAADMIQRILGTRKQELGMNTQEEK